MYPKRIVCLTEETTETLYLLGEGDRVVGISGYTVRPPEARQKPSAIATTVDSCRPSTNRSCGKSGTTSMIASSVVPGLPKRCVTPSSTRSWRKAARPVVAFYTAGSVKRAGRLYDRPA